MNKLKYHLIGIGIYTVTVALVDFGLSDNVRFILFLNVLITEIWIFYTVFAFLYYAFLITPKKKLASISFLILSVIVTYGLVYLYRLSAKNPKHPAHLFTKYNLILVINYYTHFSLYSVGYFFFERSLYNHRKAALHEKDIILTEKKNLENENKILLLQEEKARLNNQLFQSETNFLRAQINPHFLQNCLNFLYSDTRKTSPNAAEAILLLSELMRYSVADNSATGGMTMLEDEIYQVENIIQINQLRYKKSLHIIFIKEGNSSGKRIVPMILLTLVENLIKYADLNDIHNPARIYCDVNETEKMIAFKTINKKAFAAAINSSGLGFKNIKERLTLIWKDSFTLTHDDENGFFTVNLAMPYTDVLTPADKSLKQLL